MKKFTSLVLAVCMFVALFAPLSVLPASAATSGTTGDCTWRLNGTKLTICGNGAMEDYDYWSDLFAPWGTDITSVVMEDGVTSIGESAFAYCERLTSVTIPNSVTSIGDSAFSGCALLSEINVSSSNSSYASVDGVLFSKDLKTLVRYPRGKTVASYVIPDSVTSIGDSAFAYCQRLTSVTIPNSVTSIGDEAFYWCDGLTSVTIPDSVTSIGNGAFSDCTGLTSVTIPNSVKSIEKYAFYKCTGLTSVTIGNSVTSIGMYAFYKCTGLTSVTILNSVTSIGSRAFYGCDNLTIYGYAGSYAETYALEKDIPFEVIGEEIVGDLDGDAIIGVADLTLFAQHISGWDMQINEAQADCDGDGQVTISDLTLVAQYVAGWDVTIG